MAWERAIPAMLIEGGAKYAGGLVEAHGSNSAGQYRQTSPRWTSPRRFTSRWTNPRRFTSTEPISGSGDRMAFLRTGAGEKLRIGQLLVTFQPRIPMNQLPRLLACFLQNPVELIGVRWLILRAESLSSTLNRNAKCGRSPRPASRYHHFLNSQHKAVAEAPMGVSDHAEGKMNVFDDA